MILDVAEMDAASGELDHCISPAMCLFQVPRFMHRRVRRLRVLAIFKKWNKKIQKPRPFQLLFFLGGEGFQAIGRCFFFCGILQGSLPQKSHTCRIGPLVWGHSAPWLNKGSCCISASNFHRRLFLWNRSLYLPSRELTYHTFIHIPFKRYPLEDDVFLFHRWH